MLAWSCNWFILLLKERLSHIQIKGQYLNCDLKKAFIRMRFFGDIIYGANLANAFNFLDAFRQISSICFAELYVNSLF